MWRVVGHPGAVRLLERSLSSGRLAHSYLITGPPHVGKTTLALDLMAAINCENAAPPCGECSQCRHTWDGRHADVVHLGVAEEEGRKAIGIDAVRDASHQANLNPFEGRFRAIVIEGAEHLTEEAANALLKLLEEPPARLLLVLMTASPDAVLGTIRSRCHRVDLRPLATDAVAEALTSRWEVPEAQARELASLSAGRLGWAVRAWEDPAVLETRDRRLERLTAAAEGGIEERFAYAAELANLLPQQRTAVRETLDLWAEWWLERLSARAEADSDDAPVEGPNRGDLLLAVREVLRTQDLLDRNANPRLALEALMLSLPHVPAGR